MGVREVGGGGVGGWGVTKCKPVIEIKFRRHMIRTNQGINEFFDKVGEIRKLFLSRKVTYINYKTRAKNKQKNFQKKIEVKYIGYQQPGITRFKRNEIQKIIRRHMKWHRNQVVRPSSPNRFSEVFFRKLCRVFH